MAALPALILSTSVASTSDGGVIGAITRLMDVMGAPGAGVATVLENVFPPIPSEIVLPLAGFSASRGGMSLVGAILWTTAGSVVGAIVLYYFGAALGRDRIRAAAARVPLLKISDLDRTEAWFASHGAKTVFFGRMVPVFRGFVSIPAGVERMPLRTFVPFTLAGSAVWNTAFIVAGYQLGENWRIIEGYAGTFSAAALVLLALAALWFVVARLINAKRTRGQEPTSEMTSQEATRTLP